MNTNSMGYKLLGAALGAGIGACVTGLFWINSLPVVTKIGDDGYVYNVKYPYCPPMNVRIVDVPEQESNEGFKIYCVNDKTMPEELKLRILGQYLQKMEEPDSLKPEKQ